MSTIAREGRRKFLRGGVAAGAALLAAGYTRAALIVKDFVQEYQEKIEEEHVFPRLQQAEKLIPLTRVLRRQHGAGKVLTNNIIMTSGSDLTERRQDHAKVARWLRQYIRMMRLHTAREETDVFPEFRKLISREEYFALGETIDRQRLKVLDNVDFEGWVARVARLEALLGLEDLARVTAG